jgi:hypothetical protein
MSLTAIDSQRWLWKQNLRLINLPEFRKGAEPLHFKLAVRNKLKDSAIVTNETTSNRKGPIYFYLNFSLGAIAGDA